jgi:hypothetical protein
MHRIKTLGKGFFESPRNEQNGPEMGPKMLFSSWAGAKGPGTKMDPWANGGQTHAVKMHVID